MESRSIGILVLLVILLAGCNDQNRISQVSENASTNQSIRDVDCVSTGDIVFTCDPATGEQRTVSSQATCGDDARTLEAKGWKRCTTSECDECVGPRNVTFITIEESAYGDWRLNHPGAENIVIRNATAWNDNLNNVYEEIPENPPKNKTVVDFEQEMVLGVFLGGKPTGGYWIQIQQVIDNPHFVDVIYTTMTPKDGDGVTQAGTYPHHIVKLRKIDKPINFKDETSRPCLDARQCTWKLQDNGTCQRACSPCMGAVPTIESFPEETCLEHGVPSPLT